MSLNKKLGNDQPIENVKGSHSEKVDKLKFIILSLKKEMSSRCSLVIKKLPVDLINKMISFTSIEGMIKFSQVSKQFRNVIILNLPMYVNKAEYRETSHLLQSLPFQRFCQFCIYINKIQNNPEKPHPLKIADFSHLSYKNINPKLLENVGKNSKTITTLILDTPLFTKFNDDGPWPSYKEGTGLYLDPEMTKGFELKKMIEAFPYLEVLSIRNFQQIEISSIFDTCLKHKNLKTVITKNYTIDLTGFKKKFSLFQSKEKKEFKEFKKIFCSMSFARPFTNNTIEKLIEKKITCFSNIKIAIEKGTTENLKKLNFTNFSKVGFDLNFFSVNNRIKELSQLFKLKKYFVEFDDPNLFFGSSLCINEIINVFNETDAKTSGLIFDWSISADKEKEDVQTLFKVKFFSKVKNLSFNLKYNYGIDLDENAITLYSANMKDIVMPAVLGSFAELETLCFCGKYIPEAVNLTLKTICNEKIYPCLKSFVITLVDGSEFDIQTLFELHKKYPHLHITITSDPDINYKYVIDYVGNYATTAKERERIELLNLLPDF